VRRLGAKPRQTIAKLYDDLSGRLGVDDFFCGSFSYADIALFMAVLFVLRLNGPRLNAWPVLARWYARVGARPSVAVAAEEIAAADRELSPLLAH
jgi:glutathione S-transferase